jgi:tetratricopeptide (TPR) repeat protein
VELLAAATDRPEYRSDQRILRIAELCGHLPLALQIVSSILIGWGGWTPSYLIAKLEDQHRLDRLEQEDLGVRASFELSYRRLKAPVREMFRRLSAIPDSQFPAALAAEAAGRDGRQAASLVETLIRANLIDPGNHDGDIRFHDLIRDYAKEKLTTEEGDAGTWAAEKRILESVLNRLNATTKALSAHDQYTPAEMGRKARLIDDRWSLVRATLNLAMERKAHGEVVFTLGMLHRYIEMRGLWLAWADLGAALARAVDRDMDMESERRTLARQFSLEMIATGRSWMHDIAGARAAASSLEALLPEIEEPVLRASALNVIGNAMRDTDGDKALACYEKAKSIFHEGGRPEEAATATHNVANIHRDRGHYADAIKGYEEELAYRRSVGDRWEEAVTLTSLVVAYARVGRIDDAIAAHSTAAAIFEAVGDAANMSACHHDLGFSLVMAGRFDEGIAYLQQDLDIEVKRGNRRGASQSLAALGYSLLVAGREGADSYLQEAIEVSREIGEPGITAYASVIRLVMLVANRGTDQLAAVESILNIVKEHLGPRTHAELKLLCGKADSIPLKNRIQHLEDAISTFDRLGDTQNGDIARGELQDLGDKPRGSSVGASA